MNNQTCKTCLYFHQHYSLKDGQVIRVFCGHCTFPKVKTTRPFTKACGNYVPGPPDADAFASKEYLTKKMIRRLFEMDFLPQIDDCPE